MIIYFADRRMNILGQASTALPEGLCIKNDKKTEEVEGMINISMVTRRQTISTLFEDQFQAQ